MYVPVYTEKTRAFYSGIAKNEYCHKPRVRFFVELQVFFFAKNKSDMYQRRYSAFSAFPREPKVLLQQPCWSTFCQQRILHISQPGVVSLEPSWGCGKEVRFPHDENHSERAVRKTLAARHKRREGETVPSHTPPAVPQYIPRLGAIHLVCVVFA